jgi:hypothetical protein
MSFSLGSPCMEIGNCGDAATDRQVWRGSPGMAGLSVASNVRHGSAFSRHRNLTHLWQLSQFQH